MASRNPAVRHASYLRNREKILAKEKAKRAANPGADAAKHRKWRDANRLQERERQQNRYYQNRTVILARKKAYYAANPEKFRETRLHVASVKRSLGMAR